MAKGTVNKVIILGRLGADPDARTTASGTSVVTLNVATNEIGKADNFGNRQEHTEWHQINLFGRMAENAAQYLRKGSSVYIEGRLQTRKWSDSQGIDRYTTSIVGNEMQFIGGQNNSPQPNGFQQPAATGFNQNTTGFNQPEQPVAGGFDDLPDDDIPF